MSAPKLKRILDAVAARAQAMLVSGGYYSDLGVDIRLDRRWPPASEVPVTLIYLSERAAAETRAGRARCVQDIPVAGFRPLDADPEAIGIEILADIQRAIELADCTLGGLLQASAEGLAFVSDEIYLPEAGENAVGARVTYSVPHVRTMGDPEIA